MGDSAHAPSSTPVGVDPNRASIARVYDAALGGKDNYAIDREVLDAIKTAAPEVRDMAWGNRNFLIRVVRFLANQAGITQFLDCGSGLPTAENTHQVAQRIDEQIRVVYVDNDPVVLAHGNALLADNEHTWIADADIYRPNDVYEHELVRKHLDFGEPIGLLHVSTIHHYLGDDYADVMRAYVDPLPSGSFVAVSHFYDPEIPELSATARAMERAMLDSPMGSGVFRTGSQILEMVPGLEVIPHAAGSPPEVVACDLWWPDGPQVRPLNDAQRLVGCVVARKP
ncbi:SAM-dependent methyltransferase [Saccharomonospora saliphila]|uniref:SAM-dependent methyltransferase n=1 Tax=Saccharomonospora saliphila TaxID=369829 RepID=UPI000372BE70|nr:SAM-dependent methyltransferase [Saccharomonospora saliphila]